jgi:hypothetical protein
MGSDQDTFTKLEYPLVLGRCPGCGDDNEYSEDRLADYQKKGFILTSFCKFCCFKRRQRKKQAAQRPAASVRLDAKATIMTVQHVATMTEEAPRAEGADTIAAIKAAEADLEAVEHKALAKTATDADEAAEAALNADEAKAEKSAVTQAEETRPKNEADGGAAAKEAGAVTRSAAEKAEEAAAANEAAKHQAAGDKEHELQTTEIKAGTASQAWTAGASGREGQATSARSNKRGSAAGAAGTAAAKEAAKRQAGKVGVGAVTRSAAGAAAKAEAGAAEDGAARQAREAAKARREEQSSAAKRKAAEAKEAAKTRKEAKEAAAKEAAKRQADKDNEMKLQTAKAKEEETRRAQEAEDARRAEQSSAAKRKAKDDMEAAKVQEDAELAASKAETEAIDKAIQEVEALSTAPQTKTPSILPKERGRWLGPRRRKPPRAGYSKEDAEIALNGGWFACEGGETDSDADIDSDDDPADKRYREERLRAHTDTTKRHRHGSAMIGKECLLFNAEERAKLLQKEGLLGLDPDPLKVDIYVTADRYVESSCWRGPLLLSSAHVWAYGSRGSKTLKDRRTFRAQDLGQRHDAPTPDDYEEDDEDYASYSEKYGKEAHERHLEEDALYDARLDEENRKLRELMHAMGREPSTPTPPKCSRTAPTAPSPDSVLYPPDSPPPSSPSGKDSENTKNRRPSSGPRETHRHSLRTTGISLPLADPLPLPNGTPVRKPIPLKGIAKAH